MKRVSRRRVAAQLSAIAAAETGHYVLFLPVFMAAGIITYFAWPWEPLAWPAAVMAAICLTAGSRLTGGPTVAALLAAGFASAGFASAALETARAPPWPTLPRHATMVQGTITAVDSLPEGRRVTLGAPSLDDQAPLPRSLRLRLRNSDETPLSVGDIVRLRALLRPPAPPAYPGGWDTQRDAFFSGLAGYGFAIGSTIRVAAGPGIGLQALRRRIADHILAALPGGRGAIAATLLTGISTAIPAADRSAFQDSGLAHLLAVAGLHIGIVMGLAYAAVRRGLALSEYAALHWRLKHGAALASLSAGLAYLALTGAHVPILRSFAMACLVTLAILTGRRAISLRGLAVAALVLMSVAPDLVVGVSFQMSFAAVMALIAGWEALSPMLARLHGHGMWRPPVRHAAALIATSMLAGTASLPVAAYHFGNATPYYVPANLLAVPVTGFWVMPWGLASLLLMPLGLQGFALQPMGWGIGVLVWIARTVSAWPGARLPLPQMPPAALVLFMGGLCWLCVWRSRMRLGGVAIMAAGLGVALLTKLPDLLVGSDAHMIAARIDGQIFASAAKGASRFDREAPARLWGITAWQDFPPDGQAASGALACSAQTCRMIIRGQQALLIRDPTSRCGTATIILAHWHVECPGMLVVDKLAVRLHGAAAVWLTDDGPVIRTADDARMERPWLMVVPSFSEPVRLPPAMTE